MSECELCGVANKLDEHHTSYQPETTVMLCRSCHQKVHGADNHPLQPDDSAGVTTIQIPSKIRDKLKDERLPHESNYNDTLLRLLDGGSGGQLWTEQELQNLIDRQIQLAQRG